MVLGYLIFRCKSWNGFKLPFNPFSAPLNTEPLEARGTTACLYTKSKAEDFGDNWTDWVLDLHDDTQNYSFCWLQLLVETLDTYLNEPTKSNSKKKSPRLLIQQIRKRYYEDFRD